METGDSIRLRRTDSDRVGSRERPQPQERESEAKGAEQLWITARLESSYSADSLSNVSLGAHCPSEANELAIRLRFFCLLECGFSSCEHASLLEPVQKSSRCRALSRQCGVNILILLWSIQGNTTTRECQS